MSLFGNIERRFSERRASPSDPISAWAADVESTITQSTNAGRNVSAETARTMIAVLAAQSLIADGVASLPVEVVRETTDGRKKKVPLPQWLKQPNPFDRPYDFWHKIMISLVGEMGPGAFIHTQRDAEGLVISALPLDPSIVIISETSPTPQYSIAGVTFYDREILYIPAFTRPGCRKGISVLNYAKEAIGIGLAAEEHAARLFSQGTTLSGVIEHPGKPENGELAKLARMLKKGHAGLRNSHGIGVLSGGATWKQVSMTPEQAQFLETRRYQALQIAQLYRVPPNFLDPTVQSSWGTGVAEQNKFFVDYTLVPWLRRLEEAFSTLLPRGQALRFNVDARLRAKTSERIAANAQAFQNGQKNLDEIRAEEGLDPLPDGQGQVFYVSLQAHPIGQDLDKNAQPIPAAPNPVEPTPESEPLAPLATPLSEQEVDDDTLNGTPDAGE